jgi:hypothetical protein
MLTLGGKGVQKAPNCACVICEWYLDSFKSSRHFIKFKFFVLVCHEIFHFLDNIGDLLSFLVAYFNSFIFRAKGKVGRFDENSVLINIGP